MTAHDDWHRKVPGTVNDWAGLWIRTVAHRSRDRGPVYGTWHLVAGIARFGPERFRLAHGEERPAVLWVGGYSGLEVVEQRPLHGTVCARCSPVLPMVYVPDGSLSDEDVDRIAQRVVELARAAEAQP